jgi:hypothetical protein
LKGKISIPISVRLKVFSVPVFTVSSESNAQKMFYYFKILTRAASVVLVNVAEQPGI